VQSSCFLIKILSVGLSIDLSVVINFTVTVAKLHFFLLVFSFYWPVTVKNSFSFCLIYLLSIWLYEFLFYSVIIHKSLSLSLSLSLSQRQGEPEAKKLAPSFIPGCMEKNCNIDSLPPAFLGGDSGGLRGSQE
jgi:hypothetical protein